MTENLKEVLRNLIGRRKGGVASGLGGSLDALKAGMQYRASII